MESHVELKQYVPNSTNKMSVNFNMSSSAMLY